MLVLNSWRYMEDCGCLTGTYCFESECLCVLECKSAPWPRGTVKGIMTWEKGVNETPWRVWKLALRSKFCLPVLWPGISDKASWGRAVERDVLDQSHPSPRRTGFFTVFSCYLNTNTTVQSDPSFDAQDRYLSLLMSSVLSKSLIWNVVPENVNV